MSEYNEELIYSVVEVIALYMGEDPAAEPSMERKTVHCQIAMAFLSQACGNDDEKIRSLVDTLIDTPSKFLPPRPGKQ